MVYVTRHPWFLPLLMMAPAVLLIAVVFGQPLAMILRMSLNEWQPPKFYVDGATLDHYRRILSDSVVHQALRNSLVLAGLAAVISVLLGYGLAFVVWARTGRWRVVMIGLMLCPLLISEISVIFGWWMFLPRNGMLSWAFTGVGLIDAPISLLYHPATALLALVYIILPFSFFILLASFQRLDRQHLEASADLGAPAFATFREVLLPQTWKGVVLALSQGFIWGVGTYASPSALGPDTLWTMGGLVEEQMIGRANWPMASALATVMVIMIAFALTLAQMMDQEG